MNTRVVYMAIWLIGLSLLSVVFGQARLYAQPTLKKVRMGIQSTNIGFLPFHIAYSKGFYREQGIDLEMIFMSTQAVNTAFVRGDLDYSAAVNGIIQGIVRGAPAKILACAVDRPLQSFISRKEIRGPGDLKGKKVAGSTTGGTATLMADAASSISVWSPAAMSRSFRSETTGSLPSSLARSTRRCSAFRRTSSQSTKVTTSCYFSATF